MATASIEIMTALSKCYNMNQFVSADCAVPGLDNSGQIDGLDILGGLTGDIDIGGLGRRLLQDAKISTGLNEDDLQNLCVTNRKCLKEVYEASGKMAACMQDFAKKYDPNGQIGNSLPEMDLTAMLPAADVICASNPLTGDFCADIASDFFEDVRDKVVSECDIVAIAGCCTPLIDATIASTCAIKVDACSASTAVTPVKFDIPDATWDKYKDLDADELMKLKAAMAADLAASLGVDLAKIAVELEKAENDLGVTVKVNLADAASGLLSGVETKIQGTDWSKTNNVASANGLAVSSSTATSTTGETETKEQAAPYVKEEVSGATTAAAGAGVLAFAMALAM